MRLNVSDKDGTWHRREPIWEGACSFYFSSVGKMFSTLFPPGLCTCSMCIRSCGFNHRIPVIVDLHDSLYQLTIRHPYSEHAKHLGATNRTTPAYVIPALAVNLRSCYATGWPPFSTHFIQTGWQVILQMRKLLSLVA